MKKRVLYFLGEARIGGKERAVIRLLEAFRNDDEIELSLAIGRRRGPLLAQILSLGVPVVDLRLSSGFTLPWRPSVIRRLRAFDIHDLADSSPNTILYSLLAGPRVKRVFTRRGGIRPLDTIGTKKRIKLAIQRALVTRWMDAFSANTANAAASMRRQYHINASAVPVVYNGYDFSSIDSLSSRSTVRAECGFSDSDFVVGTACRLVDTKRVDLLLRAFARARIPYGKLLICGDGPERASLEALTRRLGIQHDVSFEGMILGAERLYPALDCFVLASTSAESFGNALVEAMAASIPCIVMADSPGLLEHLAHAQTGFVASDESGLAACMHRIRDDPHTAAAIASRAAEHVRIRYSAENMIRSYKQLYRDL